MKNCFNQYLFALFLCGLALSSMSQFTPGNTYFGANGFTEYRAGNLPIIISAPHGGYISPSNIPNRSCPSCVTVRDSRTQETTNQLDSAIRILFGAYPHVIINKLSRIKLDANREIVEAALGDTLAEQAWHDYHNFIQAAKDSAVKHYGTALFLDMHGHGHAIQRIELGYLMSGTRLRYTDIRLDTLNLQNRSSIKHLNNVLNNGVNFSNLLRGNGSMGELLEQNGYRATPSASDPSPLLGEPYFSGGYNTVRHGSRDSSTINAIQFELNWTGVRNTSENRIVFARTLACAIREYLDEWFFDLDTWSPGNVVTTANDYERGSLRDVLLGAKEGDTITFDQSLMDDTIRLQDELRICRAVTIQGFDANRITISGEDTVRIIRLMGGHKAVLNNIDLVRGIAKTEEGGGAILVESGAVELKRCGILNNRSNYSGGAITSMESTELMADSCTFTDNIATENGGAIWSSGSMNIQHATFYGNESSKGGAFYTDTGEVNIVNATFYQNKSQFNGGAIGLKDSRLTVNFCTIFNNESVREGGGLALESSTTNIGNTIIAGNLAPIGSDFYTIGDTLISNGYNFIGDTTGTSWVSSNSDQLGNFLSPIDPKLLSLRNNGGFTFTLALEEQSPCLDAANAINAPLTDQRGLPRVSNGKPDIGAFEFQVDTVVGEMKNQSSNEIEVYPNPFRKEFNINLKSKKKLITLTINDLSGKVVWRQTQRNVQNLKVNIENLSGGVYYLHVLTENMVKSVKLVNVD